MAVSCQGNHQIYEVRGIVNNTRSVPRHYFISVHVFFYKKLRSDAGRQFLKFSDDFAVKSFLHVKVLGSEFFKRASKVKQTVHSHSEIN